MKRTAKRVAWLLASLPLIFLWSYGCGGGGDAQLAAGGPTLTVEKVGQGRVGSDISGIDCGDVCSAVFSSGATVVLAAAADPGWQFDGWSGGAAGADNPVSIVLDADVTVTATFSNVGFSHTLSVVKSGNGTVTSVPAGIDCGVICSALFGPNSAIILTATPDPIQQFLGWGGDCASAGTAASAIVTLDADKSCSATFSMSPWAKSYGAAGDDDAFELVQAADRNYYLAGITDSWGAIGYNFLVLKTNDVGEIAWQKSYGGGGGDHALSVTSTSDGGVVIAGDSDSFSADLNFLILKLAADGSVVWQVEYDSNGTLALEDASPVIREIAGGDLVVGGTVRTEVNGLDVAVLILDASGNILLQKSLGDPLYDEELVAIEPTSDGGFIFAATSNEIAAGTLIPALWVVKLDAALAVAWQHRFGLEAQLDAASSVIETSDGGFLVGGITERSGDADFYLIKLGAAGGTAWTTIYGRAGFDDSLNSVRELTGGDVVVAGESFEAASGASEFLVMRLDSLGAILWQKSYGAPGKNEAAHVALQSADGSLAIVGSTAAPAGLTDILLMRVLADGTIAFNAASGMVMSDTALAVPPPVGGADETQLVDPIPVANLAGVVTVALPNDANRIAPVDGILAAVLLAP